VPTVAGTPSGGGNLVSDGDTMRPAGDSTDQFTNSWYSVGSSLNVDIWAGTHASDPSQAFLRVVLWDAHRLSTQLDGTFDTPTRAGPVHITGVQGTTMTLLAADGTTFAFDILSHAFH